MGHSQCKWLVRSQWSVAIWLDGPGWASRASARLPVARWGARLGGSLSPPLAEAPHHTPYHQRSAFYSTDTATLTHSTEWRWHCEIWGGWGQLNYFNLSVGVSSSALGSSQSVLSLLPPQQFFESCMESIHFKSYWSDDKSVAPWHRSSTSRPCWTRSQHSKYCQEK